MTTEEPARIADDHAAGGGAHPAAVSLGRYGLWALHGDLSPELAREAERLGYGAVWIGGSPGGDLALAEAMLDATDRIAVATGIVNIWATPATEVAESYHRIAAAHPGRFLLGVGAGHREQNADYRKPYDALVEYLDALDAAGVPAVGRALAALGPKVLALSARRSAGAHPYLTTPTHTREARGVLGAGPLLAPEQKVVLDPDPERARALGRDAVRRYLGLRNYVANLHRSGFAEPDTAGEGSDALVDALVTSGDAETVAAGLRAHRDAGADHVGVQVLTAGGADLRPALRELAAVLELT